MGITFYISCFLLNAFPDTVKVIQCNQVWFKAHFKCSHNDSFCKFNT